MRRKMIAFYLVFVCGFVLWTSDLVTNTFGWPMAEHYMKYAVEETGSPNVVTAIYLNYRYYDTLFEALVLLFSVIAVIYMSVHEKEAPDE
jgi:multicomponent Na+:H+ antiporter subunit B